MNTMVHTWKEETYCQNLSTEEPVAVPVEPVGEVELTDAELEAVFGGCDKEHNQHEMCNLHHHNPYDDRDDDDDHGWWAAYYAFYSGYQSYRRCHPKPPHCRR